MKLIRGWFYFPDSDIRWQKSIEGPQPLGCGKSRHRREACHLTKSMDTGVGPARADNICLLLRNLCDDCFERRLNGRKAWLYLPTMVVRAVVFES